MKNTKLIQILILLLFLVFAVPANAQIQGQARIDSLLRQLKQSKEDTNKAKLLYDLSDSYVEINPEEGIKYGLLALELAEKINFNSLTANINNCIGMNFDSKSDYPKALEYYFKALKKHEEQAYKKGIATDFTNIGIVYLHQDDFNKALEYYFKALKIFEELKLKNGIAYNIGNIGLVYWYQNNFPKALEYYLKTLKIFEELNDQFGVASSFFNIGNVYNKLNVYSKALDYYFKACNTYKDFGSINNLGPVLGNIGDTYLTIATDSNKTLLNALFLGNKNLALQKAKMYVDSAIVIEKEFGNLRGLSGNYKLLSNIQLLLGDTKGAFDNYKSFIAVRDSIYNIEKTKSIAQIQMKYEKEKNDIIYQIELNKQKRIKYIFIIGFLIVLGVTFLGFQQYKKIRKVKVKIELQKEKLEIEKQRSDDLLVQLENSNIILEEKVKERTSELELINKDLIIEKDKAEASDRLKSAFIQNISHEIRTPLNGIIGLNSVLIDPNVTEEEKHEYYPLLQASSDRLLNTVSDYLDIAMIMSHNIEVCHTVLNLNEELFELKYKYQSICDVKKLSINVEVPENSEAVTVNTDMKLFRKILSNIIDNAIKFTSVGSITLGYTIENNKFNIFVKDTGVGIEKEAQKKIFENFMQENISDTRGHDGSGLGLSVASGFSVLLGGSIVLDSVKGAGATFTFIHPASINSEKSGATTKINIEYNLNKLPVVLVAEDDEINFMFFETILKKVSSQIIHAVNGKEAVDFCREHPDISFVIMDIKMPVMNGLEATHEIKSFRNELPIIALTAYAMSSDEKMALEAGCDAYLAKPIKKQDLFTKLKTLGLLK